MADAVDRSAEVSVEIAAKPSTVWRCVTEGDLLSRWLGARVEFDPVVGKPVRIHFERWRTRVEGEVVEVMPGKRIAFTWGVAEGKQTASMPPGSTRVTITLAPSKAGTPARRRASPAPSPTVARVRGPSRRPAGARNPRQTRAD